MIEFDTYTDEYPQTMNVKWYRDTTLLEDQTYAVDSSAYFCNTQVSSYNKIVITIGNMTRADRFLKIFNITDGLSRQFYNDELENVEIIEQITSNNQALNINEASVVLLPQSTAGVLFQRTLPFTLYRNDVLFGRFFVNTSTSNTNRTLYNLKVNDYIQVLEGQTYLGGMYTNKTVSSLIAEILTNIPYTLDAGLGAKTVSGYLPILNKREALRQIAFCVNALVDTSRSDEIVIKPLPTTSSRTITESEITNIETTQTNITTKIELNTTTLVTKKNLTADDLFFGKINGQTTMIVFDSPKFDLSITGGTIVDSNLNYAIITGTSTNTTLIGKEYQQAVATTTKDNPYVVSTDIEKIESYNTTLVCDDTPIIDNLKFVEFNIKSNFLMSTTKVGDLVTLNGQLCRVMQLNYNLWQTNIYCNAELEAYYV